MIYIKTPPPPPEKGASDEDVKKAFRELNQWAKQEAADQYKHKYAYGIFRVVLMIVACLIAIIAMILESA